jgi:hypothetical protein
MGGLLSVVIPDRAADIRSFPALARRPLLGTDPPSHGASTTPGIVSEAGIVNVRSYVRTVDGKPVTVSAHTRGDPAGGDNEDPSLAIVEGSEVERSIAIADARSAACDAQLVRDQMVCRTLPLPSVRRSCWASAVERYAQCGRGAYIPPLVVGR